VTWRDGSLEGARQLECHDPSDVAWIRRGSRVVVRRVHARRQGEGKCVLCGTRGKLICPFGVCSEDGLPECECDYLVLLSMSGTGMVSTAR
jgi:hypothetical protein